MIRERMTLALVEKSTMRKSCDAMVQAFLANGGKVRRIANEGKAPRLSNHYCDPRNRNLFFSTAKAVRAAPARASYGVSRLIERAR